MRVTIPAALEGERVDRAVSVLTGRSRSEAAALVAAGGVHLDRRPVTDRSQRVGMGQEMDIAAEEASTARLDPDPTVPVPVVHCDEHLIVVDKPAGLVVHPGSGRAGGTLVHGLLAAFPELASLTGGGADRPGIVHRLDKGTSGLLAVARTPLAYRSLVAQLRSRAMERSYLALVWGHVQAPVGLVDAPVGRAGSDRTRMAVSVGGREARTRYRVLERLPSPPVTLVECGLETGRTHQVRVHLAAIGHPLVGDSRYGRRRTGRTPSGLAPGRHFLHAHRLSVEHPASGDQVRFSSELPDDLAGVLARWRAAAGDRSEEAEAEGSAELL